MSPIRMFVLCLAVVMISMATGCSEEILAPNPTGIIEVLNAENAFIEGEYYYENDKPHQIEY